MLALTIEIWGKHDPGTPFAFAGSQEGLQSIPSAEVLGLFFCFLFRFTLSLTFVCMYLCACTCVHLHVCMYMCALLHMCLWVPKATWQPIPWS